MPSYVDRTLTDALGLAAGAANIWANGSGWRSTESPYFSFHGCTLWDIPDGLGGRYGNPPASRPPEIDWTQWDGSESLVVLLNRLDPLASWTDSYYIVAGQGYATRAAYPGESTVGYWLCEVIPWMLPYVSGRAFRAQLVHTTPPIWPGLANVTLGTPVALDDMFTVQAPCNGVIVDLTTVPSRLGSYDYDGVVSYVHAGSLTFLNDYEGAESAQAFSFDRHVLCPRSCWLAAAVVGRTTIGVLGTVTPWTINAAI